MGEGCVLHSHWSRVMTLDGILISPGSCTYMVSDVLDCKGPHGNVYIIRLKGNVVSLDKGVLNFKRTKIYYMYLLMSYFKLCFKE